MTGIFAFDGPLYCDKNKVYCSTTITNEMLNRYFRVIDRLYILIRTRQIDATFEEANLKKLDTSNIEVIEFPNLNTPVNFMNRHRHYKIVDRIIERTDLVFLRIPSIISNIVADRCRKMRKPYLVEVGGCAWDSYFNHSLMGKLIAPYMYFKQKSTVLNASFASYVTSNWLQKRYPTDCIQTVASNVYLSSFDETVVRKRIENYVYKKENKIPYIIGTIASVDVRYKGQEYIVKALSELKKKGYFLEYRLVGAGNPEFLSSLARKYDVLEQVKFEGVKLHSDIWKWLDKIDIYAQPSRQEGLPRAVIEAMSRGCLCIGSTTAGIPELLEQKYIFKNCDVSGIVNIIIGIMESGDYFEDVLRNFNKSKEFSVDILDNRRQSLFQQYKSYCETYIRNI